MVLAACGSSPPGHTESATHGTPPPATTSRSGRQPKLVRVPRLRGKRFGEAVHLVNRAGLRQEAPGFTGTTGNPNYSGRCIKVISQSPPPGTLVAPDSLASIVEGVCNRAITRGKRSGHH